MTEAEAAQQIGENLGLILVAAGAIPGVLAAPLVALISLGSFLFGKKYERKWNKKGAEEIVITKYENTEVE